MSCSGGRGAGTEASGLPKPPSGLGPTAATGDPGAGWGSSARRPGVEGPVEAGHSHTPGVITCTRSPSTPSPQQHTRDPDEPGVPAASACCELLPVPVRWDPGCPDDPLTLCHDEVKTVSFIHSATEARAILGSTRNSESPQGEAMGQEP